MIHIKKVKFSGGLFLQIQSDIYPFHILGKLVLSGTTKKGLGGGMHFLFRCNGCWAEEIDYQSSNLAVDSRRQLVSLALCLAFFYKWAWVCGIP